MSSGPALPLRRGSSEGRPGLRLVRSSATSGGRGRRPSPAAVILALVASLCAVGLVMVLSASAYTSEQIYGSVWYIFERQVLWMLLGALALVAAIGVPYERWRSLRVPLLVGAFVLLLAVLVPGIGTVSGGSSRWIGIGVVRIQPSELMKLALAVFGADLLARRAERVARPGAVVVPLFLVFAVAAFLLLRQPDMGTALVLCFITLGVLFAGGVPMRILARASGLLVVLGVVFAFAEPYRRQRLLSFVNPFASRDAAGYQVVQSLVGLGNGHLFGLGLGNGHQKWGLLPNPHTDFIFSVIGEETGLVGALVVLALFAALAWFGVRAALDATDRFGSLLCAACVCWITAQAVINIGAVIGVLPVTGIPLPFVSFGGSSLVITMVAAGIMVNVARTTSKTGPRRAVRVARAR